MDYRKYVIPGLVAGGIALALSWAFVRDLVDLGEILVAVLVAACWIARWQWVRQRHQRK